jgi:hypothetical protein
MQAAPLQHLEPSSGAVSTLLYWVNFDGALRSWIGAKRLRSYVVVTSSATYEREAEAGNYWVAKLFFIFIIVALYFYPCGDAPHSGWRRLPRDKGGRL